MAEDKVRLGGMALANGVLVHGPTSWACAIRTDDGRREGRRPAQARPREQGREPAPARPRPPARRDGDHPADPACAARGEAAVPATLRARGDARQRDGREARCAARLGSARCAGARRRSALARAGRARAPRLGGRRLPRRRAHLDRHLRAREARDEGARALRLASASARSSLTTAIGNTLASRAPRTRRGLARARRAARRRRRRRPRSSAGWCAIPRTALARALAKPGHELQHRFATAEPSPEQIEVAEAALAACLELERNSNGCRAAHSRSAPARDLRPSGREDARGLLRRRVLQPRACDAACRTTAVRAS